MKYLSLFSGIGGFELGIKLAYALSKTKRKQQRRSSGNISLYGEPLLGTECIGYSEIDNYAIQIYKKHFPKHKNYGDITKITADSIPDFDLLVGGFPCQSFSIAGKRRGFQDVRGTLFFDIARIINQKQPRLLLLENVKGLLSHDNGKTFYTIISTLNELGYDLQWQVLNSKNHGVPQNRERVFIIGHLRGTPRPKVFPFGRESESDSGPALIQANNPKHSARRVFTVNSVSPTLRARAREDETGPPLVLQSNVRRLTPTECERLQGFPDGWTDGLSDTQRYKCLGNAVTVNVIRDIVIKLI